MTLSKIKSGKAAGPSAIVAEMLKPTVDLGVELMRQLTEAVFKNGVIPRLGRKLHSEFPQRQRRGPKSWQLLRTETHRSSHEAGRTSADPIIRRMVHIDQMQFGFVPGRCTTDAIFTVRQLQEKHIPANRRLYCAFVDLGNAFDRVPRQVL